MRKKIHLFILMLIVSLSAWAQQKQVTGKVTDSETGEPLPGVSVIIKGTSNGTITDIDGNYEIKADNSTTLSFSFIGFSIVTAEVSNQTVINIKLQSETIGLNEVVAIGYGTVKKRDLTGAVSSIRSKELADQPYTGIDQALQGKVSGVTVTQNSGAPGGGVSVRVRGVTSLTGSNEPLYVIDGVPMDGGENNNSFNFSTLGGGSGQLKTSALSNINPSDILSIEVLKDASAAAIYGARGANGVVLITTKKGEKGEAKITYEGYYGVQATPKFIDVMNAKEYAQFYSEVQTSLGRTVPFEYQDPSILSDGTDWQREIFRVAPITNHQISISGGKDKTKVYTSISYYNQDGIVINSDFQRASLRLNLDQEVNKWISVGNNISMNHSIEHITLNDDESGVISTAVRQSPMIPVHYSDGSWGGPTDDFGVGNGYNPVAWASIKNNEVERYKVNGNFYLNLKFGKYINFRSDLGYDFGLDKTSVFNPTYKMGNRTNDVAAAIAVSSDKLYWVFKNYLNFDRTFNQHSVNLMVGQEAQQNKYNGLMGRRDGFYSNSVHALRVGDYANDENDQWMGTWSMLSYFGRANYSFEGKYLLTATLRADASSNFGPNNKWGYFPSFSGAWVVSEESFMKNMFNVISYLKVRGGYGEIGNQNIEAYAYGVKLRSAKSVYGTAFAPENLANPNVKWETAKSTNIGLELGFLENKIKLDVDLYRKTSSDFLLRTPMPSYLGANNVASYLGLKPPVANLGEIENKGVDLAITTRNITKSNATWSTTFIVSAYRNKVLSLAGEGDAYYQTVEFNQTLTKTAVGQPVGMFYGYKTNGLFRTQDDLNNSPSQGTVNQQTGIWLGDIKYQNIDASNNVIDDNDKTYIGNPHPDFTFSINNNVTYKRFELALALSGSYGNDIYNWTRKLTEGMREPSGNQSIKVKNRFIEGVNENTNFPRFADGDPNDNSRVSNRYIEDGSYIRIQNLTLAYSFDKKLLEKSGFINSLRVYGTVQNLYTFTNYSGYDPEVGAYSQNAMLSGFDNGRYPSPRTIMFGLNVEF